MAARARVRRVGVGIAGIPKEATKVGKKVGTKVGAKAGDGEAGPRWDGNAWREVEIGPDGMQDLSDSSWQLVVQH